MCFQRKIPGCHVYRKKLLCYDIPEAGNCQAKESLVKKYLCFLSFALCVGFLSGCVGTTVVYTECTDTSPAVNDTAVRTGLGIVLNPTVDSAAGAADFDLSLAAVLVDGDGVILDCVIDGAGASVQFDSAGAVTTGDATLLSKNELGYQYGMLSQTGGAAAGEWFQQANALALYAVGKTMLQVRAGIVGGYARDADLATSATIYLGALVDALEKAVANAVALGAQPGDTLRLSCINTLSGGELNCDAIALTLRNDVITSCSLDALQTTLDTAEDGTVIPGNTSTKNELGYAYGMVSRGGATYEWFQQAENFAAYVTGKTAAQVAGLAVTEGGRAENADLASSVTISIAGFQALVAKAG